MSSPTPIREFPPPLLHQRTRRVLGVVALVLTVLPVGVVGLLLGGPARVEVQVSQTELHVRAGMGLLIEERRLPLDQIRRIERVQTRPDQRLRGTALAGHCSGRWRDRQFGEVWLASTCGRDLVLVDTAAERLLLGPADPPALEQALRQRTPWQADLVTPPPTWLLAVLVCVLLGTALGATWLALLTFRGAERLTYRIGPDGLEVQTWRKTLTIPLQGVRVRRQRGRLGLRLMGTGLPGYCTGWFRVDGRTAQVWATRTDQGVVLEGSRRWLVTPADVEGFLAAAKAAGAQIQEPDGM